MTLRRSLQLKRETLTPIGDTRLAEIVGAKDVAASLLCITDKYRVTCLNCE